MATVAEQIQKVYIGLLGRAADKAGLDYWTGEIESGALTLEQLRANIVEEQPEYQNGIGQMTRAQAVNQLYQNLFNRSAEDEGLNYWVNGEGADVSFDQLVLALVDGASAADTLALDNKVQVAAYYTEQAGDNYTSNGATAAVDDVDGGSNIADAKTAVDDALSGEGSNLVLTQRADDLQGTDGDDVFTAPVTQNETGSGALANTFETGDKIDGAGGNNTLKADLIASGAISDGWAPAISAETTNIQEVYLRAQATRVDNNADNTTFGATVDAEKMVGVEQWWTDNSRANVRIEDIRSTPDATTFGMRLTDPGVGYEAYFNPLFMDGGQSSQSQLVIQIAELDGGVVNTAAELANISVNALSFELDGDAITISSDAMAEANTWEELETAIVAALEEEGLGDLQVTRGDDGQFLLFDAEGRAFSNQGGFTASATTDEQIDVRNRITQDLQTEDQPTQTTLVLDGAGSGSRGGAVNIAAMSGDRGVEVMDVVVDRDSAISSLSSVNSPNTNGGRSFDQENQLEEVNLTHLAGGAEGDFQVGTRTIDSNGVSTTTDDRLNTNGLTDVRVFDATGFTGETKVGASLTANAFDKYLLGASEPVEFNYLLGDGGNNLTLAVNNMLAGDTDFELNIVGGTSDDRINLGGLAVKQQTSVDGGENSSNTLEVTTSTGFAANANGYDQLLNNGTDLSVAQTSFEDVSNIDTLVVATGPYNAGTQANAVAAQADAVANNITGDTTHDITEGGYAGVSDFVIATTADVAVNYVTPAGVAQSTTVVGPLNTRLINLDAAEQSVTVSGKNQTLGTGNSDNAQAFGTVRLSDTAGSELDLLLANTARATGNLNVNTLTIDNTVGNVSEVRTLNLDSDGVRQTTNSVGTLNGNLVNTFNLVGSQALTITDLASAANSTAGAAARDNLVVDGSELGGDLYLGVTGAVISAVDAAANRTVNLQGTEGENDILNIRDGVVTSNATTIADFETIRFGQGAQITAATSFNASNVSGAELYDLVDTNVAGTINLNNLGGEVNVQINANSVANGTNVSADVTLSAGSQSTGNVANVNFTNDSAAANYWTGGTATLAVQDFRTVSLDMGGAAGQSHAYNFTLDLLPDADGDVYARTLEVTGGQFTGTNAAGVRQVADSIRLDDLDTALTTVDFSNYVGNFQTSGWASTQGTNADVIVNDSNFTFDIGGDNTVFAVPASTGGPAAAEVQTLDFTAGLGFGDLADGESITITFAGGEYVFTNNTGAAILEADINTAIINDAASSPSAFDIADDGAGLVELTANRNGDMPTATIAASDAANNAAPVVANITEVDGDLDAANVTGYDLVTAESEFLTKFVFSEDAYAQGVVWQIDNFQAIDAGNNLSISNQTQLDLRDLGVDSSTKITIQQGDQFLTDLGGTAFGTDYDDHGNAVLINTLGAGDTVITSNDGLDFTIVLQGVNAADLQNENIVGIA